MKTPYWQLLKDPRWQKKRLEIFERDGYRCIKCEDKTKTLHVHHLAYEKGKMPWEYSGDYLVTLCEDCHEADSMLYGVARSHLLKALLFQAYTPEQMEELADILINLPPQFVTEELGKIF